MAKNKKEEADNIQFMEEMAAKKAAEHAEVIEEARKLLLYTKPQCRLINRALLTSEVIIIRERKILKFYESVFNIFNYF